MTRFKRFIAEENGSSVVDWVILTAATAALSLALMGQLSPVMEDAGVRLGDRLAAFDIPVSFGDWNDLRASLDDIETRPPETPYVETRY